MQNLEDFINRISDETLLKLDSYGKKLNKLLPYSLKQDYKNQVMQFNPQMNHLDECILDTEFSYQTKIAVLLIMEYASVLMRMNALRGSKNSFPLPENPVLVTNAVSTEILKGVYHTMRSEKCSQIKFEFEEFSVFILGGEVHVADSDKLAKQVQAFN